MNTEVVTVSPTAPLAQVFELLLQRKVKAVPVVDAGEEALCYNICGLASVASSEPMPATYYNFGPPAAGELIFLRVPCWRPWAAASLSLSSNSGYRASTCNAGSASFRSSWLLG